MHSQNATYPMRYQTSKLPDNEAFASPPSIQSNRQIIRILGNFHIVIENATICSSGYYFFFDVRNLRRRQGRMAIAPITCLKKHA
jgi:hypothetical protein